MRGSVKQELFRSKKYFYFIVLKFSVAPTSDCSNLDFVENLPELVGASTNGDFGIV